MPTPQELAVKPAGDDQIKTARQLSEGCPELEAEVDAFMAKNPNRGEMIDFLGELRKQSESRRLELMVLRVCRSLGIEHPTSTEKLLALQTLAISEQTAKLGLGLKNVRNSVENTKAEHSDDSFTPFLGGTLLGVFLAK